MPTRSRNSSSASRRAVGQSVLIAAFSGRALAQSARRAGFRAAGRRCLRRSRYAPSGGGFSRRRWRHAAGLQYQVRCRRTRSARHGRARAPHRPHPGLRLRRQAQARSVSRQTLPAARHSPQTIAASKDPATFFATLDKLNVPHPETRLTPPADPADGWLTKRIGGSGGATSCPCSAARRDGAATSSAASRGAAVVGCSRSPRIVRCTSSASAASGSVPAAPSALTATAAR